jgi:signal transduction histidine kinase
MSKIPSAEDKTHLQSIAETAMNNIFGVDIKLARQRDEGIRKATLFLPLIAHETRSGMNKAALIIDEALDTLEGDEELDVKPMLRRAGELMQSSANYLKSFEKAVYEEVGRVGSDVTPASLERQIRRLIPPDYEDKIHWVVSGAECVRTPSQSELLAYAVLQMINNAIEAVETLNRTSPVQDKMWCIVEIEAEDNTKLVITIRDCGPGFKPEQIESLNSLDLEPVQSSHQGGYGIKTTRLMINQGFKGKMILVESGPEGTTWEIVIPNMGG